MSQHRPDPEPDGAFDRLRAADPAAGHEPDLARLDAAVRHRVGRSTDELSRARASRRPSRWAAVAAVAAGTLVVGSVGGYALGTRADAGPTQAAAPAISLGGGAGAAESSTLGQDAARSAEAAGGAAGAPAAADVATSTSVMPWFGGRTVFTAQGLSDEGGAAQAWSYDPAQVFGAETAARVAASLRLEGEPRLEGGAWVVGPQDGLSPSLQLQPDGVASVSYYDPTRDPFGCREPLPDGAAEDAGGGDTAVAEPDRDDLLFPPCEPPEPDPAPQGDAAVALAREVLTAAGVDGARFEYEVVETGSRDSVHVTAYEVLQDQRTGLIWSLTFVGSTVQALYGGLAPLVPLGSVDVVSPAEAVQRLTDPRFGFAAGGPVIAAAEGARVAEDAEAGSAAGPEPAPEQVGDPTPPAAVEPGEALAWPVTEVVLTGARLGLAQHTEPDGATVLVPAYELSADDGSVWSVIAVAESALDFSPVG